LTSTNFEIQNIAQLCSVTSAVNTVAQKTWITVVATYHVTTLRTIRLQVDNSQSQTVCTALRSNRTATYSYIGRSAAAADTYFEGLIASVHVVDALLSSVEITVLAARMRAGTDPLAGCTACPAGMIGPCAAKCPADKYANTPNLIAFNVPSISTISLCGTSLRATRTTRSPAS